MNAQNLLSCTEIFNVVGNPYLSALLVGLFYGMTLCSVSCLPYVCTCVMGTQEGFSQGFKGTLVFCSGRIVSYTLVGGLCGHVGKLILNETQAGSVLLVTASVILLIGTYIVLYPPVMCSKVSKEVRKQKQSQTPYIHLITLGLVIGLVPCLPFTAVLLYSSTTQSIFFGALIALTFSVGTCMSPLCFVGGATAWVSKKIRLQIPKNRSLVQRTSGVILVVLGARLLCMALLI